MASKRHGPAHRRQVFRHGLLRAGLFALYSGLVLAPFMTHVLHAFHAEHDGEEGK